MKVIGIIVLMVGFFIPVYQSEAAWSCQANYGSNNPYQMCIFNEPDGVVGGGDDNVIALDDLSDDEKRNLLLKLAPIFDRIF